MLLFDFHAIKWWLNYSRAVEFMFQGQWRQTQTRLCNCEARLAYTSSLFFQRSASCEKIFCPDAKEQMEKQNI